MRHLPLPLLAALLHTCGGPAGDGHSDASSVDAGADAGVLPPEPRFDPPAIRFDVETHAWGLELKGAASEGPPLQLHQESAREGQCRLLRYSPSTCNPACDSASQTCIDGTCASKTVPRSVGTVSLSGVLPEPVEIVPVLTGSYYWQSMGVRLDEGTEVGVQAEGAVGPAFFLSARTTVAPTPSEDWDAQMAARQAGEDVTLAWSNPSASARVYLRMTTGIGTHGGISPVELECEGPDSGTLTLPGAFLDDLYAQGWSCGECGVNALYRYRLSEQQTSEGLVELRARSRVTFYHHPGL